LANFDGETSGKGSPTGDNSQGDGVVGRETHINIHYEKS